MGICLKDSLHRNIVFVDNQNTDNIHPSIFKCQINIPVKGEIPIHMNLYFFTYIYFTQCIYFSLPAFKHFDITNRQKKLGNFCTRHFIQTIQALDLTFKRFFKNFPFHIAACYSFSFRYLNTIHILYPMSANQQ